MSATDTRHDPVRGSGAEPVDGPLGRLVVVFDNHIARALVTIAEATGWQARLDEEAPTSEALREPGPDAVVVCDHDADGAYDVLRGALRGGVPYVAMMASRHRSATLLEQLGSEGFDGRTLARLHLPAGLSIGGRGAGEIALSVMAEIVADGHGRDGRPMRGY